MENTVAIRTLACAYPNLLPVEGKQKLCVSKLQAMPGSCTKKRRGRQECSPIGDRAAYFDFNDLNHGNNILKSYLELRTLLMGTHKQFYVLLCAFHNISERSLTFFFL